MEFEQGRGLYTFHQTLLDHVGRQPAPDPGRALSSLLALLAFHADYVSDHSGDDVAIDRCVENILSILETAWGLRQEESPLDGAIGFVVDRLGNCFERRGLWRVGERWLERAIDLRRSSAPAHDRAALSGELYQLAQLLYRRGEHTEARRLLRESIAAKEELGDRRGRAASLHQLAIIEHAQGNPAEARRLWEESIEIKQEIGDLDGMATSLDMLAQLNAMDGRFEEAVAQGREAVGFLEEIGSFKAAMARKVPGTIEAMAAGGAPAGAAGPDVLGALLAMPPDQALAELEQPLGQARADGRAGLEVMLLVVKSMKSWEAGDVEASDQALEEAGRALERVEGEERGELEQFLANVKERRARAGRSPSEAVRLHHEGIRKAEAGDHAGALECFQKSADLSRSDGDDQGVAVSLFFAGQILLMLGRVGEARETIREGLELATELGDEKLLEAMRTIAAMAAAAE